MINFQVGLRFLSLSACSNRAKRAGRCCGRYSPYRILYKVAFPWHRTSPHCENESSNRNRNRCETRLPRCHVRKWLWHARRFARDLFVKADQLLVFVQVREENGIDDRQPLYLEMEELDEYFQHSFVLQCNKKMWNPTFVKSTSDAHCGIGSFERLA